MLSDVIFKQQQQHNIPSPGVPEVISGWGRVAQFSCKRPTRGKSEGKEHVGRVKVMCSRLWDEPWGVNWLSGKVVSNVGFILVMVVEFSLPLLSLTQASLTLLVLWWLLVWVPNTQTYGTFFVFSSCLFCPVSEIFLATRLTLCNITASELASVCCG